MLWTCTWFVNFALVFAFCFRFSKQNTSTPIVYSYPCACVCIFSHSQNTKKQKTKIEKWMQSVKNAYRHRTAIRTFAICFHIVCLYFTFSLQRAFWCFISDKRQLLLAWFHFYFLYVGKRHALPNEWMMTNLFASRNNLFPFFKFGSIFNVATVCRCWRFFSRENWLKSLFVAIAVQRD